MGRKIKTITVILAIALTSTLIAFSAPKYKFASFGNSFDAAKKAGYEGVQLDHHRQGGQDNPNGYSQEQIAQMKKKMAELNMQVCSICVPCYHQFLFEDDKNGVDYMKNIVDNAAELGAENILIPFFGNSSLYQKDTQKFRQERLAPLVKRIKEIAPYAASKGIVLAIENTITPEDNIKLLDMINEPNVKIYFDTLNIVWAGNQPDVAIKKLGKDRIAQIHIKANAEYFDEAKEPQDFKKCFQTIVDSGYEGWIVLEIGVKIKKHSYDEVLKHNLEFFKKSELCK